MQPQDRELVDDEQSEQRARPEEQPVERRPRPGQVSSADGRSLRKRMNCSEQAEG